MIRREQTADTKQLGDDVTSWCHIEHKANEDRLFVSGRKKKKEIVNKRQSQELQQFYLEEDKGRGYIKLTVE